MIINYNGRKVEVTYYEFQKAYGFIVHHANFIDGDMRDLTHSELSDLEDNYFESLYEAMPKGTGY